MTFREFLYKLFQVEWYSNMNIRVHIGNQLYDVKNIDTVIDMETNKPNIVIHVDDK